MRDSKVGHQQLPRTRVFDLEVLIVERAAVDAHAARAGGGVRHIAALRKETTGIIPTITISLPSGDPRVTLTPRLSLTCLCVWVLVCVC